MPKWSGYKVFVFREISLFFAGHINVLYAGLVGNIVRFFYISWLKNPWWVLPFECIQGELIVRS